MAVDPALRLDLTDEIEQLLGTAHRKAGDDHVAAPVQSGLQNLGQLSQIIGSRGMIPVPVGGLHDHKVCFVQIVRVPQQRLVYIADVSREYNGLGLPVLGDAQGDAGTAQQVAHVGKDRLHPVKDLHRRAVLLGFEQPHGVLGVLHGIFRFHLIPAAALCLAVFPLRLLLLDVGGVLQHDLAQVHGRVGGVNGAPEPVFVDARDHARMVNVGVGQQDGFDFGRCTGQLGVFVHIAPLFHAAIHQKTVPRRLDQRTAAGDLPGGT